jgi:dTDP-4-dehydrorhamnose 3,5-epimerase
MKFFKTNIPDLLLVEIDKFEDERGYLAKFFDKETIKKNKIEFTLTQIKYTYTKKKGTIRGMHLQSKPFEEAKIVHCMKGRIYEVAIDLRKKSKTYGKWFGMEFTENEEKSLFVPKGFAHGYQALTDNCEMLYMMSGKFSKAHNIGYRWDDPFFNIKWPIRPTIIAEKDKNWPLFSN